MRTKGRDGTKFVFWTGTMDIAETRGAEAQLILVYYFEQVGMNAFDANLMQGRIINLGISCKNATSTVPQHHCLLFKFQGYITCKCLLFYHKGM